MKTYEVVNGGRSKACFFESKKTGGNGGWIFLHGSKKISFSIELNDFPGVYIGANVELDPINCKAVEDFADGDVGAGLFLLIRMNPQEQMINMSVHPLVTGCNRITIYATPKGVFIGYSWTSDESNQRNQEKSDTLSCRSRYLHRILALIESQGEL